MSTSRYEFRQVCQTIWEDWLWLQEGGEEVAVDPFELLTDVSIVALVCAIAWLVMTIWSLNRADRYNRYDERGYRDD
jgi:hypothetical protein